MGVFFKPSRVGRKWCTLNSTERKREPRRKPCLTVIYPDLEKRQQKDMEERPRSWAVTLLEAPTALLILLILCVPLASQRIRHSQS